METRSKSLCCVIFLMLLVDFSNSVLIKGLDDCWGYAFREDDKKISNLNYLGQNQITQKHVYLKAKYFAQEDWCGENVDFKDDFKTWRYESMNLKYFTNDSYKGEICWTYKSCSKSRNYGGQPFGFEEKVDPVINHKVWNYCNYICRTVYRKELGRC